ncbi:hypothetical protein QBC41DRAFT_232096 [Cercophora samala]|uniref:Uncharacterized protein n=1 Tax=Cercophora samala TaxID=330535 RepID=A0AA40D7F9_9PEZI|nr:hypothetical protein QBC41DRAFT_232096 [Cercophora samala]
MTKSGSSGSSGFGTGNPDPSYDDWYRANGYYLETFWSCHKCGFGPYHKSTTVVCVDMHCQHHGPCPKCTVSKEWIRPEA